MNNKHHYLKTEKEYYQAHINGDKSFEIRDNDRDFRAGDSVTLEEVVFGMPTGRQTEVKKISYILYGPLYGLANGCCIMQLS